MHPPSLGRTHVREYDVTPEQWATTGAGLVVILGGLVTYMRWVRPLYRRAKQDVISGRDALLGRDEIRDSITNRVIAPALPGMGIRMDRNEQQMTTLTDAVAQIAPALVQLSQSHDRLDEHDRLLAATRRDIDSNRSDISELRNAYMERIAGHIDSAAAFDAIKAIANKNDDTTPDK